MGPQSTSTGPEPLLKEALRIARTLRRVSAVPNRFDDREPMASRVRRALKLRAPELPAWAKELRPHDPSWRRRAAEEAASIYGALGAATVRDVQHIGSTAIPHLRSKPILDLVAAVRGEVATPAQLEGLGELGYEHFGNSPCDREAEWLWKVRSSEWLAVVHLCGEDNPWRRDALSFRDYLCAHPDECARYERRKRELAAELGQSLLEYSLGKLELVFEITARANAWKERGGGRATAPP